MFIPVSSAQDIGQVAALANEIWREHYTPIIGEAQVTYMLDKLHSAETIAEEILSKNFSYFLLREGEDSFGYLGIQMNGQEAFLSKIYIASRRRGRGDGKVAMNFAGQFAREQGASVMSLTVNKHNTNTIEAYYKMGFVKTGEKVADIGGGYFMDDYLMELRL